MDATPAPNAAYVIYMFVCVALLALVYLTPALDLRGVGRVRRRRRIAASDEAEFAEEVGEPRTSSRAEALLLIPRADLTLMVAVLALGGVLSAALLGFLGPRILDQAIGRGVDWMTEGAWAAPAPLERVAQVAGALTLGLVALRMLRVFMALAAFLLAVGGAALALNFVLGRPLLW
ncbi:MAG: hypothetical protein AAFW46_18530 [Pseudomonadota bacterium]